MNDTNSLEGFEDYVSYQIKRKRERKRMGQPKRRKPSLFSHILEIMFSSFLFLSFFDRYTRLNYFSWLKGYINLEISKTVRSILFFLFNLYDKYECFPMLISYNCLV